MERQFTASVYILHEQRVLLIFHRKLNKWLPPGGHLEANETPIEAVKREAYEETGLRIALIPQENVWVNCWNANSFERPFLCLLEEIPAHGAQAAHQHIDFVYIATVAGGQMLDNVAGEEKMRWFTFQEIQDLVPDQEIFQETQQVIQAIVSTVPLTVI